MNHLRHYVLLMRKAEDRGWRKDTAPCYVEGHHVFMTSIFGKNDRVVFLTAREHFVAHSLLWNGLKNRYGQTHTKTRKAAAAISTMALANAKQERRLSSRQFETAKKALSESMKGENHWTKRLGAPGPLVRLNKDPDRAKMIGLINKEKQRALVDSGNHHFLSSDFIETTRQRMKSGLASRMAKATKGKLWWNDGLEQRRAKDCPGPDWVRGRLPFKRRRPN